jgi:hypothetical protein
MKRKTYLAALLVFSAALAALLTARQPSSIIEVKPEGERRRQDVRPADAPNERMEPSSGSSEVLHSAMLESAPRASYVDEETSRRLTHEIATKETRRYYSLLLDHLGLAGSEREALMSVLIEDQLLRTTTPYARGGPTDPRQRSKKISAVIGEARLAQFLSLERHLAAYGEVYSVGTMLEKNGTPMTKQQREKLLELLIAARDQSEVKHFPESERTSIKQLKEGIAARDEYERHVLELSVSALSPKQLQHLFDHFQFRSQERARAVEFNMKLRANDATVNFVIAPE